MTQRAFALLVSVLLLASSPVWSAAEYSVADEQLVEAGFFGTSKAMLVVPDQPKALLLLFPGGEGALRLSGKSGFVNFGTTLYANFLVRSRREFFEQGYAVLILDAPGGSPMTPLKRLGALGQVPALVDQARAAVPALRDLPVWAVGTSAGTISVGQLIAWQPGLISGAVLTSSVTRRMSGISQFSDEHPRGVASMRVGRFDKPVLVISHKDDQCDVTPAVDADLLGAAFTASPRKQVVVMETPANPNGEPCEAFSPHGFYDIEREVVTVIDQFIQAGPR